MKLNNYYQIVIFLSLFPITLYAQFSPEKTISRSLSSVYQLAKSDINLDGKIDIVAAGKGGVVWYENNLDSFGEEHIIYFSNGGDDTPVIMDVVDIDLDGDDDVIYLHLLTRILEIYYNNGAGVFFEKETIYTIDDFVNSVISNDIDQDGDIDIIINQQTLQRVSVLENDGNGNFTPPTLLNNVADKIHNITLGDLDQDGDIDIIGNSGRNLVWLENDGSTNFTFDTLYTHTDNTTFTYSVTKISDINMDGVNEVVLSTNNGFHIFTNNGNQDFTREILTNISGINSIRNFFLEDYNQDGYLDIFYPGFYSDNAGWIPSDGMGGYASNLTISSNAIRAADILLEDFDNDGQKDIAYCYFEGISVGKGNTNLYFSNLENIRVDAPAYVSGVGAMDVDNDGDMDVIAGYRNSSQGAAKELVWFENFDNEFRIQHNITVNAPGIEQMTLEDIDNDGYIDIVATQRKNYLLVFYRNTGMGTFETPVTIATSAYNDFRLTDVNNDELLDAIYVANNGSAIYWIQNNGNGSFSEPTYITSGSLINYLSTADMDGDNDSDLLFVDYLNENASWMVNDGSGIFSDETILVENLIGPYSIEAGDLDGDFDVDITIAVGSDDYIAWYSNDGSNNFSFSQEIANHNFPQQALIVDIDYDGDKDILGDGIWFANDGVGNFQQGVGIGGGFSLSLVDIDQNGGVDVLKGGAFGNDEEVAWYQSSYFQVPSLDASLTNTICLDNNTPFDTTDDIIEFSLTVNQILLSDSFILESNNFSANGIYDEELTYTLAAGSAGNGDVLLTVTDSENTDFQTTITVIDPGSCSLDTSIDDLQQASIKVFPNPSTTDFHFEMTKKNQEATLIVYNMLGQKVAEEKFVNRQSMFKTTNSITNTYFYRILNSDKALIQKGTLLLVK